VPPAQRVAQAAYTEVDVESSSEAYKWLELWLSEKESAEVGSRCILRLSNELGPY
jgi:hypothetical protein